MEYPVVHLGQTIGKCTVTEEGLYWHIHCECEILSDQVERLYCGDRKLGVLEKNGRLFTCHRKISKASCPQLSDMFSLSPQEKPSKTLLGKPADYVRQGDMLLFPYMEDQPCPCEPLICFFEIKDGYWRLPAREEWVWTTSGRTSFIIPMYSFTAPRS